MGKHTDTVRCTTTSNATIMNEYSMRKVEELSGVCTVERGGTRDRTVVTGVREGYSWRNMPLDGGQQPGACTDSAPDQLSCCMTILALNNNRMFKMKSGSFPGLNLPNLHSPYFPTEPCW